MMQIIKKFVALLSVTALFATLFLVSKPIEAEAAGEITIVGTIVNTRTYYNIDGPVSAYAFIPATLTSVNVGGKNLEITAYGAGTDTAALGTNDLSSYVGVTRAYTGKIGTTKTAPFKYTFVISSVAETPAPDYVSIMTSHLTELGYINVYCTEYSPGEVACQADSSDFRGNFYFYMHGGVWGEINAVVTNPEHTGPELEYGTQSPASGGFAKAQKVATIFAQYQSGAISKDAAQKSLNALQ